MGLLFITWYFTEITGQACIVIKIQQITANIVFSKNEKKKISW